MWTGIGFSYRTSQHDSSIRTLSGLSKSKQLKLEHFVGIYNFLKKMCKAVIYYPDVIEYDGWHINEKNEWYLSDAINCTKNL